MRRSYLKTNVIEVDGVVALSDGGTSADNAPEACTNLGLVPRFQIGEPLGPVPIGTDGKIPLEYLQGLPTSAVELDGPAQVDVEAEVTYFITNYDVRLNYTVQTVSDQSTVSIAHDIITYRAPMLHTEPGGFIVNGLTYEVELIPVERIPNTPAITAPPANLIQNVSSLLFICSAWSTNYPEDSLQAMIWQVASDSGFTNILDEQTLTNGVMDRIVVENVLPGESRFVRVAHRGHYGYTSEWSATRIWTRPAEQRPVTPVIVTPAVNGDVNANVVTVTTSAFNPTAPGDTHLNSDIQLATDAAFTNVVWSSLADTVNKTSWNVTLPNRDVDYYIRVRHRGSEGWESLWSNNRQVRYVPIEKPETPTITSPAVNGVVANSSVTFTSSAFVATAVGDTHESSTWQFATVSDFSLLLPISVSESAANKTSITVTIPEGQTVYARVSYKGTSGWTSDFSSTRSVLVNYPLQPSIQYPISGATNLPQSITFVSSDLQMVSGDTYASFSADWQVASDNLFVNIVASASNLNNAKQWTPSDFGYGFSGYVRTRHISPTGQTSQWSVPAQFTVTNAASVIGLVRQVPRNAVAVSVSPMGDRYGYITADGGFGYREHTAVTDTDLVTMDPTDFRGAVGIHNPGSLWVHAGMPNLAIGWTFNDYAIRVKPIGINVDDESFDVVIAYELTVNATGNQGGVDVLRCGVGMMRWDDTLGGFDFVVHNFVDTNRFEWGTTWLYEPSFIVSDKYPVLGFRGEFSLMTNDVLGDFGVEVDYPGYNEEENDVTWTSRSPVISTSLSGCVPNDSTVTLVFDGPVLKTEQNSTITSFPFTLTGEDIYGLVDATSLAGSKEIGTLMVITPTGEISTYM